MTNLAHRIEQDLARPGGTKAKQRFWRIAFVVSLVGIVPIGGELGLRIAGYMRPQISLTQQARTSLEATRALNARFETDAFVPDRYLLWRMAPESNVYGVPVSSRGIFGAEITAQPESNTVRILCLADSVTGTPYRTYPGIAQRLINGARPRKTLEILNAGIAGYSTEQVLRASDALLEVRPALVVVALGWSDQFRALNLPDKELGARSATAAILHRLFSWSRIYQWLSAPERADTEVSEREPRRVGLGDYAANLEQLAQIVRDAGAEPVLATQPENLRGTPSETLSLTGFAEDTTSALLRRREYNRVVREVASRQRVTLLDLEEAFNRRDKSLLFEPDGIHLNPAGHNLVARLFIGMLRNRDVISQKEFDDIVLRARYDTTAPDRPRAAYELPESAREAQRGTTVSTSLIIKNTGNTTWLRNYIVQRYGQRERVSYGAVQVAAQWRTSNAPTTDTVARTRLRSDLLPGESTSTTLELRAPDKPGVYALEIGLEADEVGPLARMGAETTTFTLSVK